MSLRWTICATIGVILLTIGIFVGYEVTVRPSSSQRQQFASAVWGLTGIAIVGLWLWFASTRRSRKVKKDLGDVDEQDAPSEPRPRVKKRRKRAPDDE